MNASLLTNDVHSITTGNNLIIIIDGPLTSVKQLLQGNEVINSVPNVLFKYLLKERNHYLCIFVEIQAF